MKNLSELVQCSLEQPVCREMCYGDGECSYDWWKQTEWIGVKSDCKECELAISLQLHVIKSDCNQC
jgi:hypothetical protein